MPVRASSSGLLLVCVVSFLGGCSAPTKQSTSLAYVENGVPWAYGKVTLSNLDAPGDVVLEKLTPAQSPDASLPAAAVDPVSASSYRLFGADTAATSGERDLAYVDYDPSGSKLLAYAYSLDFVERQGSLGVVDVYALLRKGGFSAKGSRRVYLGNATFIEDAGQAKVRLSTHLSMIAQGVYQGLWALHYPNVALSNNAPWATICGSDPDHSLGGGPTCKAVSADLCGGSPTASGCKPIPPSQLGGSLFQGSVSGMDTLGPATFQLAGDQGEVTFVSSRLMASDDANDAALCASSFLAVARSDDGSVNQHCKLERASATPHNGMLSCALNVSFVSAQKYQDKVCDIRAIFNGASREEAIVQVLKP